MISTKLPLRLSLSVAAGMLTGCGGSDGSSPNYMVGATVSGLVAGPSVVLQDNGADNLAVSANGSGSGTIMTAKVNIGATPSFP